MRALRVHAFLCGHGFNWSIRARALRAVAFLAWFDAIHARALRVETAAGVASKSILARVLDSSG
jgi:hypothetical protein